MCGIAIAVDQGDDGDLDARRSQFARRPQDARFIQRIDLVAVRADAAGDLAHQFARYQRRGTARVEAHRMRNRQPLQFEQVAKADRGDHANARAPPLDQGIRRDGAAMGVEGVAPRGFVRTQRRADFFDAGKDGFTWM
jgi:hypothetical protein